MIASLAFVEDEGDGFVMPPLYQVVELSLEEALLLLGVEIRYGESVSVAQQCSEPPF